MSRGATLFLPWSVALGLMLQDLAATLKPLVAPLEKGQEVGTLKLSVDGKAIADNTAGGFGGRGSTSGFDGWTIGGGVEWMLSPAWTFKVEYQHFDFGRAEFTLAPTVFRFDERMRAEVVKFGLNYKFDDWGKAPVVAKY